MKVVHEMSGKQSREDEEPSGGLPDVWSVGNGKKNLRRLRI